MAGKMPQALKNQLGIGSESYAEYAKVIGGAVSKICEISPTFQNVKVLVEPGTALVSDTMVFATKVHSVKSLESGENYITVYGTSQGLTGIGSQINLPISQLSGESTYDEIKTQSEVVGNTCIENDVLQSNYSANIKPGEYLIFENVGSYSVFMKPPFIEPAPPVWSIDKNANLSIKKRREHFSDLVRLFINDQELMGESKIAHD